MCLIIRRPVLLRQISVQKQHNSTNQRHKRQSNPESPLQGLQLVPAHPHGADSSCTPRLYIMTAYFRWRYAVPFQGVGSGRRLGMPSPVKSRAAKKTPLLSRGPGAIKNKWPADAKSDWSFTSTGSRVRTAARSWNFTRQHPHSQVSAPAQSAERASSSTTAQQRSSAPGNKAPPLRSGRRRDYSRRPPTPPDVRFRIRRFMKPARSAAEYPAAKPVPCGRSKT